MEAAHTLPFATCRTRGAELVIDGLRVDDETLVRLVREREDAGENPDKLVRDALEIGARVLDREHAGANADFVKAEFEKAARELDKEFVERARHVADGLDQRLDAAFGPENGHVTKVLAKHFGDESSVAVQHRVRTVVSEVAGQMREDLRKQFSSDSDSNPLALFQRMSLAAMKESREQQGTQLRVMTEKLEALKVELTEIRAEKQRLEEVAVEVERGTAKGRTYEEAVFDALEALANARGDSAEAVGDLAGSAGRKGDVLVGIEACAGPVRGRIVFEAKDRQRLSRNAALEYLDKTLVGRDADYAVLVVPGDGLPAKTQTLREFNGDKLFVAFDPEDGPLGLEVAYGLARARVLMRRGEAAGLDSDAVATEVERAQQALEDVRRIKSQLTGATTGIEEARKLVDVMAMSVRGHLAQIDALLNAA